jgi:hypothetical protein
MSSQRIRKAQRRGRAFWVRQLHQWHWISSAICLVGMLLFAVTGITLNHAAQIEARPAVTERKAILPAALLPALAAGPREGTAPLPPPVRDFIAERIGVAADDRAAEWSADEIYLGLPRPGGDAWISIDREGGEVVHESTDRGWVSYLNDLHKGRHTGAAWSWFIDVFAVACVVFCATGLCLLQIHAGHRPATWPVVGLGLVVPLVLALIFVH